MGIKVPSLSPLTGVGMLCRLPSSTGVSVDIVQSKTVGHDDIFLRAIKNLPVKIICFGHTGIVKLVFVERKSQFFRSLVFYRLLDTKAIILGFGFPC